MTKVHMQNFFDCVRSRQEPNCPFELGFRPPSPARWPMLPTAWAAACSGMKAGRTSSDGAPILDRKNQEEASSRVSCSGAETAQRATAPSRYPAAPDRRARILRGRGAVGASDSKDRELAVCAATAPRQKPASFSHAGAAGLDPFHNSRLFHDLHGNQFHLGA